nr:MAG: MC040.1L [Molluscum contagiosum virus]
MRTAAATTEQHSSLATHAENVRRESRAKGTAKERDAYSRVRKDGRDNNGRVLSRVHEDGPAKERHAHTRVHKDGPAKKGTRTLFWREPGVLTRPDRQTRK